MGHARQQAGAQQAQLQSQANMASQEAWAQAIGQAGNAFRPLAIAPFAGQLANMAQTNPQMAMIAGSLLGVPGLTAAGSQQSYFNAISQLHDQASQQATQQQNQQYAANYGFTPQDAPAMGQKYFEALPASAQGPVLSQYGFTPDTFKALSPQQQNSVYTQMAQQAATQHRTAPGAVMQDQQTQGLIGQVASGQVAITDPSWAQKWSDLNQSPDENVPQWAQSSIDAQKQADRAQMVGEMQKAGVLQPKVDPDMQIAGSVAKQVGAAQKAGITGKVPIIIGGKKVGDVEVPKNPQEGSGFAQSVQPLIDWGRQNGLSEVPIMDAKGVPHMLHISPRETIKAITPADTDKWRQEATQQVLDSPEAEALRKNGRFADNFEEPEAGTPGADKTMTDRKKMEDAAIARTLKPMIDQRVQERVDEYHGYTQQGHNQPTVQELQTTAKKALVTGAQAGAQMTANRFAQHFQQQNQGQPGEPTGPEQPQEGQQAERSPNRDLAEKITGHPETYLRKTLGLNLPKDFADMPDDQKTDAIDEALGNQSYIPPEKPLPAKGKIKNGQLKGLPDGSIWQYRSVGRQFHDVSPNPSLKPRLITGSSIPNPPRPFNIHELRPAKLPRMSVSTRRR